MAVPDKTNTEFIVRLADLKPSDIAQAGAKATNEAEMLKAGFAVPTGIVLTTAAFDHFLKVNAITSENAADEVTSAPIPSDVLESLHTAINVLGEGPFAVRSSAIAEDLPEASFAGQYETVLNVRGADELEVAVRRCWLSVFNPHVVAYRQQHGLTTSSMAVLIQQMVAADVAGVAFTANPVSGDREEAVINAVCGLGERLVSGEASPDEWTIKGDVAHCLSAPENAIDAAQALTIAQMARQVATHFGTPQDIEWALSDGQLYVLQSRPITTLADETPEMVAIPIEVPSGFWARNAEHFPLPHFPMNRHLFQDYTANATKRWIHEFGLLVEDIEEHDIGGWSYVSFVPLGGKEGPALPKPLMWLLVRLIPMMRARTRLAREAVHTDKPGRFVSRWYNEWHPELASNIRRLQDVDLIVLADRELNEHIETLLKLFCRAMEIHALLTGSLSFILYDLVITCHDVLGWNESKVFELVNGTSFKSTEPARRLHELALMAQKRPAVQEVLENIDERSVNHLADVDTEFAQAFADYMHEYGCRALRYEVADLTLAETPALALSLMRGQIAAGYDPEGNVALLERKRTETAAEARAALMERPDDSARFERVLERAIQAYPTREDNEFYTVSAPLALIRYAALELGNRLTERGSIVEQNDVFFLELEDARRALFDGRDYKALVKRRKGERAWALAHPGPASYGEEPAPPSSLDFLPTEARLVMESLMWYGERMGSEEQYRRVHTPETGLAGIAASSGQYTGTVRVIMSEAEFHKLQAGDVLVCPMTSPVWSLLFPNIGALVTDSGGMLSHPAIIAREYRIPAVVATGNATTLLQDGQIVTVDGTVGTVRTHS